MSVYYNIDGTTKDTFKIGKGGITLHTGTQTPTGVDGDFWLDTSGELKVKVGGTWELTHFDNISLSGNTIASTDTDGDISIVPDGAGDVVLGAAAGGTSTMTAPDDQDVVIQAGEGTSTNDGGDLTLRGGLPQGAGAYGNVILGTATGGSATMTSPDDTTVILQAGPATTGNPGADFYLRGGDGTAGTGIDGDVIVDTGNLEVLNDFIFDTVILSAIQTSAESFVDDDVSIMTSAAINDLIAVAAPTPTLQSVTTEGSTTTTSITAASFIGPLTGNADTVTNGVYTSRTISTTAPLTGGGDLSTNRTLAMAAATTSVDGYLTSTDWNTFNNKVTNVTTNLTTTHNASTVVINSSDGTNATINAATATTAGIMSEAIYDQHVLNNAKETNVTTNITVTENPTTVSINSSDGTDDTIAAANGTNAGVMTTTMYDEHVLNNAKNTNVTTNLSLGTITSTNVPINSSDGTNISTLPAATASLAGIVINGTQSFGGAKTFTGTVTGASFTTGDFTLDQTGDDFIISESSSTIMSWDSSAPMLCLGLPEYSTTPTDTTAYGFGNNRLKTGEGSDGWEMWGGWSANFASGGGTGWESYSFDGTTTPLPATTGSYFWGYRAGDGGWSGTRNSPTNVGVGMQVGSYQAVGTAWTSLGEMNFESTTLTGDCNAQIVWKMRSTGTTGTSTTTVMTLDKSGDLDVVGAITGTSFAGAIIVGGHTMNDIDITSEYSGANDHLMTSQAINNRILDFGYTTNTGTVTAVNNGNGMNFTNITGSGTVTLGTPGSSTSTSTNAVTTSSHTHAIDSTIARSADIPDNTDYVDLTTTQATIAGTKTFTATGLNHIVTTTPIFTVKTSAASSQDSIFRLGGARTASSTSDIAKIEFMNIGNSRAEIAMRDPAASSAANDGSLIIRTYDNAVAQDALTFVANGNATFGGTVSATNLSGTNTGDQTTITGNAGTATTLQTARTINGVSFNGSANITVEPYISSDDTGDTNCPIVFTADTTAGYKRLYEDSALYFDNTNNILYTGRLRIGGTPSYELTNTNFSLKTAETLGSTQWNNQPIIQLVGETGNDVALRTWILRDATGSDWNTTRFHTGISVDSSFVTPRTNTLAWKEHNTDGRHHWGTGASERMTLSAAGALTATSFSGAVIIGGHTMNDIDITSEYSGANDHLMTSQAINNRILDFGYTSNSGTVTSVTGGTGVDSTGGTTPSITLDLAELTTVTTELTSSDFVACVDGTLSRKITLSSLGAELDTLIPSIYNTSQRIGYNTANYMDFNLSTVDLLFDSLVDFRFSDGGAFIANGNISAYSSSITSDRKLKKNITPIECAVNKINKLTGCEFEMRKDNTPSAGLIAQDVQAVLPQAVTTETDVQTEEEYLALNYNAVIGLLVQGINELTKRVEELEHGCTN